MRSYATLVSTVFVGLLAVFMLAPQPADAQNCLYCPGLAPDYGGDGGGGQSGNSEAYSSTQGAERTLEMWFKADDVTAGTQTLFESGNAQRGFNMYIHDGTLYAGAWADTLGFNNHWLEEPNIESGSWHHVAYVLDANNDQAMLYHDGELVASGSPGGPLAAHPSANGYAQANDTTKYHDSSLQPDGDPGKYNYFSGMVDQVRIWRTALTQRDLRSRMNRQLWNAKFDEGAYGSGGEFEGGTLSDTLEIHWPYNASSSEGTPGWGYIGVSGRGVADEGNVRYAPSPDGDLVESDVPVTTGYMAAGALSDTTGNAGHGPAASSVEVTVSGGDTTLVSYFGDPDGTPISVASSAAEARLNVGWSFTGLGTSSGAVSFGSGNVTFDFSNIGDVQDASTVKVLRRDGTDADWTDVTSDWSRDGMTFSNSSSVDVPVGGTVEFAIGGQRSNLPVELTSFAGSKTDAGVRLTWRTASETNNAGFQVQRKTDGAWSSVGFVESKAQGGSTEQARTYRFTDSDLPFHADELTYRLKQVDLDGSSSYSDVVTVDRGAVEQLQIGTYPNPVQNSATVNFAVPEQGETADVTLRLYNVLGQSLRTITTNAETSRQTRTLDVSGLSSGVYFLRLEAGGQTATQRFTVVR